MTESVSSFASLGKKFEEYRPRLSAMLERRIDPSLARRVDPDDVLNEAFSAARIRWLNDYVKRYPQRAEEFRELARPNIALDRDGWTVAWRTKSSAAVGLSIRLHSNNWLHRC